MKPQTLAVAAAVAAFSFALPAHAQAPYPNQTIKFIVPNPPGALPDTIARVVGKRLKDRVNQSVVIENRPGANAGLGTAALTTSQPDGYTFLITDGAVLSISPLIYAKLPYDPKEMLPVSLLARAPLFLAVHPKVPATTLKELVDYAKANPGKLNYGSIGLGSFHHLSMEAMNAALGLSMNHIPYKGSSETIGALLGGHLDLLFASYAALRGAVDTKQVRLLATNGAQRSPQAPDLPPVADMIPGYDLAVIQGLFARTGTPQPIVQKVAAEMAAIVRDPEVIQQFGVAGIEPVGAGPDEFRTALANEAERIAKVVQIVGLKAQ